MDYKAFPNLVTQRLVLRKLNIKDCDRIFEIFSDEDIMRFYGKYPMKELSEAQGLIERLNLMFDEDRGIRWAIELKENGEPIGTCGFHNWNKSHSRIEIGYELHKNYWRKGYIREALQEAIAFGFDNFEVHRIEALIYPENVSSMKSLEALGFEFEGELRDYAFFCEKYQNLKMYSLLRTIS